MSESFNHVHAEINYQNENGDNINSDLCPSECSSTNMSDYAWRYAMHAALEEWMNKSGGTGFFWVGNTKPK